MYIEEVNKVFNTGKISLVYLLQPYLLKLLCVYSIRNSVSLMETMVLPYKTPPPPLSRLKLVYSYVIEVADSEYQLLFHRRPLVSEIFIFPRIRVLFYTTIRENASINTPST